MLSSSSKTSCSALKSLLKLMIYVLEIYHLLRYSYKKLRYIYNYYYSKCHPFHFIHPFNFKEVICLRKLFILILIITILFSFYTVSFANNLEKLDSTGNNILKIFRRIAYWVILIKAIQEVMKCAMSGDTHSLGGIIMKYILMYGALFMLPWLLRLVEGVF